VARTVRPGVQTRITTTVLPSATCTLYADAAHTSAGLELVSDSHGQISFHVKPIVESATQTTLLDCADRSGARATYAIALKSDPSAPMEPPESGGRTGEIRQPLRGDLTAISDAEIIKAGFPPRPDPKNSPGAYERWARIASVPQTVVSGELTPHPRQHNGGSSGHSIDPNWAGGIAAATGALYTLVEGGWVVPSVSTTDPPTGPAGRVNGAQSIYGAYSSTWVGLDGNTTPDLIQCGTRQDAFIAPTDGVFFEELEYYSWVEYLPGGEMQTSLQVNANDEVFAEAWVCDSQGNVNPNGGNGCYFLGNPTTHQSLRTSLPIPSGTTFVGNSAEWITETPLINGGFYPLPYFAPFSIYDAYADDGLNENGVVNAGAWWIVSNRCCGYAGDVLLTSIVAGNSVDFYWQAFQ
jgi:hypothetical protein